MFGNRHIRSGNRLAIRWLNDRAVKIPIRHKDDSTNEQRFRELAGGMNLQAHLARFPFPRLINDMQHRIFELFTKMVTNLPPQAIFKALDLECQMLKNDVEHNRRPLPEDAFSVFYFREFVKAIRLGRPLNYGRPLPPDHIEFFKKTMVRLVKANELPSSAMDQFDYAFVSEVS